MSDDDINPGKHLPRAEAEEVFDKLVATFRDNTIGEDHEKSKLPLHCAFKECGEIFWGNIFDEDWISDDTQAYFMDETPVWQKFPQRMYVTSVGEYRLFLKKRLPYEWGECYLFDLNYTWCIIINHDDLSFYAEVDTPQEEERD